jgi:hypothetical protein
MLRIVFVLSLLSMTFLPSVPAFCQGVPGCFPPSYSPQRPCPAQRPEPPITRTVQVDVPVPCAPVPCGPPMACAPYPCAPPVCVPPPCPTKPIQVRVDVVVRPEAPKPCVPQTYCCENPPVFEPIFCRAAGLVQSLIAAPLGLGERFMGHPVPTALPVPQPVPCWRMCGRQPAPCYQPPPVARPMGPCPQPVRCAPPQPPAKCRPTCAPISARKCPPQVPAYR